MVNMESINSNMYANIFTIYRNGHIMVTLNEFSFYLFVSEAIPIVAG